MFENIVKPAIITSINYQQQTCFVQPYDRVQSLDIPIPLLQPGAGINSGFFFHPEEGTIVLLDWGFAERPYIVAYLPNSQFTQDLNDSRNFSSIAVI